MNTGAIRFLQSGASGSEAVQIARGLERLLQAAAPTAADAAERDALLARLERLPQSAQRRVKVYLNTASVGILCKHHAMIGLRSPTGLPGRQGPFSPGSGLTGALARAGRLFPGALKS